MYFAALLFNTLAMFTRTCWRDLWFLRYFLLFFSQSFVFFFYSSQKQATGLNARFDRVTLISRTLKYANSHCLSMENFLFFKFEMFRVVFKLNNFSADEQAGGGVLQTSSFHCWGGAKHTSPILTSEHWQKSVCWIVQCQNIWTHFLSNSDSLELCYYLWLYTLLAV